MLDKKKSLDENKVVTIIGPGTTVSGEIESKGTVRIEGTVTGRVDCEDTIVVHESGHVKADLIAGQVIISGTVEGNTFAHERLEVTNQGKIVGNITAPRISIAEGVIFEGKCTMKPQGQLNPPKKSNGKEAKEAKKADAPAS
ncbi:MAG TPA: polymer-forming cytoskeletal family protein [Candidatus Hydrogenedentes bacterium]|nr:polymer-forming cytoskeletal family protein [Candidatus Hydrogenedentota bacterium]